MFTCTYLDTITEIWPFNPSSELLSFGKRDLSWRNATASIPCLYTFSRETLNTQTHWSMHRNTQQSDSKTQLPLSSFQPQISEPDMTLFLSAELVCYLAAGGSLRLRWELISCVCRCNTETLSSLKEVKQLCNTQAYCLTPVLFWKMFGKCVCSSGENYSDFQFFRKIKKMLQMPYSYMQ